MKRHPLLVLMLYILPCVCAAAQNAPDPPPYPYFIGILRIKTVPVECAYTLDGVQNYKSEEVVGFYELPVGKHTVEFENAGKRLRQEINLRRAEVIVIEADFSKMTVGWRYSALQGIMFQPAVPPSGSGYTFGAGITNVSENSTFRGYDIRVGDIVVRIGGSTFASDDEYLDKVFRIRPGDLTKITILRNGKLIEKEIRHLPRSWENVRRWFDVDSNLFKMDR